MTESQQPPASNAFKPVRGIFIIILAVVAVVAVSKFYQAKEIVPWRTDYAKAQEESRSNHKPLFVYFTAQWCGPCQELKHTLWADEKVDAALRAYVPVKIDIDEQPDLAAKFSVNPIPAFGVLDLDGKLVKGTAGAMETDEFLKWLKR